MIRKHNPTKVLVQTNEVFTPASNKDFFNCRIFLVDKIRASVRRLFLHSHCVHRSELFLSAPHRTHLPPLLLMFDLFQKWSFESVGHMPGIFGVSL